MSVSFANKRVGDGEPCFVTFEAGPTHSGLESAKRLVKHAAEAGADAVKFQFFDPDRLIADKKMPFSYGVLVNKGTGETETVEEPLYDILCRRCMTKGEWRQLKQFSDSLGLAFFSTVAFDDDVDMLVDLGCDSIKIASGDVDHFPLIRKAARTGMCIQLDTGSSTIGEVEAAVDIILREGNSNIIIHQCPSGYPARLNSINLNIIPTLKRMFPFPVAFSDHTPGWEMDVAAVALGANLLEKTITENRMTRSVEHVFSLEPPEMRQFIRTIRDIEVALGHNRRTMTSEELTHRQRVRRSVYIKSAALAGQKLSEIEVEFRRPGFGIAPDLFEKLMDKKLARDMPAGTLLGYGDMLDA